RDRRVIRHAARPGQPDRQGGPRMSNVAVLDALLGSEFYYFARKCFHTIAPGKSFVANWHLKAIAHELKRIERGETTRLIVNLPPRSGTIRPFKSLS